MRILGVVASAEGRYTLSQTYTSATTYTVPSGVNQIAIIGIAQGGAGVAGATANISTGPSGGGGGGGGAFAFWNRNVTSGQVFTLAVNAITGITVTDGSGNSIGALRGQPAFNTTQGGAGGTTTASGDGFLPFRTFANGGNGGNGALGRSTNGAGTNGTNGGNRNQLYDATWAGLGLPNNIFSGYGGGGGGTGARDTTGSNFFSGGTGGTLFNSDISGGDGGSAFQDGIINGVNGTVGLIPGTGGGGGGSGAYQLGFGNGTGGTGNSGNTTPVFYVYVR